MIETDIVVIDSGIDIEGIKGQKIIVGGVHIYEDQQGNIIKDEDYQDNFGHGSAVANMVFTNAYNVRLFIIKIYDYGVKTSEKVLNEALRYVLNNVNCSFINISCGVVRCTNISEMEQLCVDIQKKGINIIAAFDNNGRMSYPAAFMNVIGVDCSFSCYKIKDFQIARGNVVDVRGMAYTMRIPSIKGKYIQDGGSSFVCGYITGVLWDKFQNKKVDKNVLLTFLENNAIKKYSYPERLEDNRLNIHTAILIPFTKEMHNLVRFINMLDFSIEGIFDLKYSGNVGSEVGKVIHEEIECKMIIEDMDNIDWSNGKFDTVICGSLTKTNEALGKDVKKEILSKCRMYGKQIYMFDEDGYKEEEDLNATKGYKAYIPLVTEKDNIYNQFGKLHEIGKPVLAVFGTSPKQGKFSLQLELRKRFINNGYRVGQLGTEPNALLFGMDEIYNFGFNATVHIAGFNAVTYVNELMYRIERKNPDIIITGSQSQTVQYSSGNIGFYPVAQYEFLLGVQPDTILLCVTVGDDIEYVQRTIQFLRAVNKCKILGIVLFPFKFKNVMGYLASHKYDIDKKYIIDYKKTLKETFSNINVFDISQKESYDEIYNYVLMWYGSPNNIEI